jgi:hypothetical protein
VENHQFWKQGFTSNRTISSTSTSRQVVVKTIAEPKAYADIGSSQARSQACKIDVITLPRSSLLVEASLSSGNTPPKQRRPALSFSGKLPPDWSAEQQEALEKAVADVALRSRIRHPGFRAMQLVKSVRDRGKREAEGPYDLR